MQLSKALGLRSKIALPFGLSAVALILTGCFSVLTFQSLISAIDEVADRDLPAMSEALNGDRDLYQSLVAQMSLVDAAARGRDTSEFRASFEENAQQAFDRMKSATTRLMGTGIESKIQGFDASFNAWKSAAGKSIDLAEAGARQAAESVLRGNSAAAFDTLRDYFDVVGVHAEELAQASAAKASEKGISSTIVIVVIAAASLAISLAFFAIFLKLIIRSIKGLKDQLDNIAQGEGDLTTRVPVESDDDLGQLATSFNQVLNNLQGMIGAIQGLSDRLNENAKELSTSARDNNDGVTRQTDLISMVATAINEMQSAIEEVAGNASHAADVTREAQKTGENSGRIIRNSSEQVQTLAEQIGKAVNVIRKLSEDSENITSVLDVIRGVAEQTNLLALNAAIEAARAGEQGRGFAVVADEVRTLAQRTQQSTEDIQRMITTLQDGVSDIVQVMETGSEQATNTEKLATEAEQELQAILQAMNDINDVNTSVASATEEQTQVVEEINSNIVNINELASESSRRSKSISSISQTLGDYADELRHQTGRFKV